MKPGPSRNFIFKNEIPKSGVIKVRNFMLNNELPHAGSEILSPKVRDVIFNNEIPKSEVTTVRNFIVNDEILNSGNQITLSCPKVLERAIVNFHIELL